MLWGGISRLRYLAVLTLEVCVAVTEMHKREPGWLTYLCRLANILYTVDCSILYFYPDPSKTDSRLFQIQSRTSPSYTHI